MTSIYQQALGPEFDRLHPKLQWRFGFSSANRVCHIGTGVMDEVWRGRAFTLPFLLLGSTRRVLFPSRGQMVSFTISNYAYVDSFGRDGDLDSPVQTQEPLPALRRHHDLQPDSRPDRRLSRHPPAPRR
jgi:hypothetical protein